MSPSPSGTPRTSVTLRALDGEPLKHEPTRRMVVATAEAIAERTGVQLLAVETEDDRVTLTLSGDRIAAIGFAAELRRLTTSWCRHKFGVDSLWGVAPEEPDSEGWDTVEGWR